MSAYPLSNNEIHDRIETIKKGLGESSEEAQEEVVNAVLDLVGSTLKTLHNVAVCIEDIAVAIRSR